MTKALRVLQSLWCIAGFLLALGCTKVSDVAEQAGLERDAEANASLMFKNEKLKPVTPGAPYSEILFPKGGIRPYTFSVITGSLPEGLALDDKSGLLTGEVAKTLSGKQATVTFGLKDGSGLTAQKAFTLDIGTYPMEIFPIDLPPATPSFLYSVHLVASGAVEPVKCSVVGALPPGLALQELALEAATGIETRSANSEWPFELYCIDAMGIQATRAFTLRVGPAPVEAQVVLTPPELQVAYPERTYSLRFLAVNGVEPVQYSLVGELPTGLSLSGTELRSVGGGIARNKENTFWPIRIVATDGRGVQATREYSLAVGPADAVPDIVIAPPELAAVTPQQPYNVRLAAVNARPPVEFVLDTTVGNLPQGLELAAGRIRTISGGGGVPAALQNTNWPLRIVAIDAGGTRTQKDYVLPVGTAVQIPPLAIQNDTLTTPTAGSSYLNVVNVSGGVAPYNFLIESGNLPNGLVLGTTTGVVSGVVAFNQSDVPYVLTVRVTDSLGATATKTFAGTSNPYQLAMSPSSLPPGQPESNYSANIIVTGGDLSVNYSITSGALPAGLSLNAASGVLSGTVAGSEAGLDNTFVVRAVDARGRYVDRTYTISVASYVVSVTTVLLPNGTEGNDYDLTLTATGGSGGYHWEYFGNLPGGVSFSNTGRLFGTPAYSSGGLTPTPYSLSFRARDSEGRVSALAHLTLRIGVSTPTLTLGTIPIGARGAGYSHFLRGSAGRPPYLYQKITGTLPPTLDLNSSSGEIWGVPNAINTCPTRTITVRITDALNQNSTTQSLCIDVVDGVIISTSSVPSVRRSLAYTATIEASGGVPPYSFTDSGTLPLGMAIGETTGIISGTTAVATGTTSAYITVQDSSVPAKSSSRSFTLRIVDPVTLSASSLPVAASGRTYSQSLAGFVAGGTTPYTYAVTSGSLPAGLSLNASSGLISGTVAASLGSNDTYSFSVTATDVHGIASDPRSYAISIFMPPSAANLGTLRGKQDEFFVAGLTTPTGVPPFSWNLTGLPVGLSIVPATGILSGTPVNAGSYTVTATVRDSNNFEDSTTFTLVIGTNSAVSPALGGARFSEPCRQDQATANCMPQGYDVAHLPQGLTGEPKYLVYSVSSVTVPFAGTVTCAASPGGLNSRLYVARFDSEGRIASPQTSVLTKEIIPPLDGGGSSPYITSLKMADLNNDGNLDLVYTDYCNARIGVLWGRAAVDGNTMPVFAGESGFAGTSGTDFSYYGLGAVSRYGMGGAGNGLGVAVTRPYTLHITNSLRGNANYKDIVVAAGSLANFGNGGGIVVMKVAAACSTACPAAPNLNNMYATADMKFYNAVFNPGNLTLRHNYFVETGNFFSAKTAAPPGGPLCKDIAFSASDQNALPYVVLLRNWNGTTACTGEFGTTAKLRTYTGGNYSQGLAVADFNKDNYDDFAVVFDARYVSGTTGPTYVNIDLTTTDNNGNSIRTLSPTVPERATHIIPYCRNGTSSCDFPSLLAFGGRHPHGTTGPGGVFHTGFISIIPNRCTAADAWCDANVFENGSGDSRIDYAFPTGLTQNPVLFPVVGSSPTLNDLVMVGQELVQNSTSQYHTPYVLTLANAGANAGFQQGALYYSLPNDFYSAAEAGTIRVADLNNDGKRDIITHLPNQGAVAIHLWDTDNNRFSSVAFYSAGVQQGMSPWVGVTGSLNYPANNGAHARSTLEVGDLNNDGKRDVVVMGYQSRGFAVLTGNGTGALSTDPKIYSAGLGDVRPVAMAMGDMDNDGKLDLVFAKTVRSGAYMESALSWLRGKGNGEFFTAADIDQGTTNLACPLGQVFTDVSVIDLDNDGRKEVAVLCSNGRVSFYRHFQTVPPAAPVFIRATTTLDSGTGQAFSMAFGRLSNLSANPEKLDLVIGHYNATVSIKIFSGLSINLVAGTGAFAPTAASNSIIDLNGSVADVAIGDFDLDGRNDIAASLYMQNGGTGTLPSAGSAGQILYLIKGNGLGSYSSLGAWGMQGAFPTSLAVHTSESSGKPNLIMGYRVGQRLPYQMLSFFWNWAQ